MRTTLTLNDSLINELKTIAQETGKPYRLKPTKLGQLYPDINLDKALQLASVLEDEALVVKLEQQK